MEFLHCFREEVEFYYISPANPRTLEIFQISDIFFKLFPWLELPSDILYYIRLFGNVLFCLFISQTICHLYVEELLILSVNFVSSYSVESVYQL